MTVAYPRIDASRRRPIASISKGQSHADGFEPDSGHGDYRLSRGRKDHAAYRILTETHGRRYAVVVNEFGEVGIDNDLIVNAEEENFEMNNGFESCHV